MAEIDVNAYATTAANAAASAPSVIETQQPGGTGALRQVVVIGDPTGRSSIQGIRPDGYANVKLDPTNLLFDTFETLDTTNVWTTSGTTPPTGVSGNAVANPGTAASATSLATSKPTFIPTSSAYLQFAAIVQIEAAVITGAVRIWGLGVLNGTPTTVAPITNGSIFEVGASDGLLYGRVYSGGAKTQEIALTRPTDGAVHRYQILYKASRVYFNIDNVEVGSLPFPNPQVAALSTVFGTVNGGTVLTTATSLSLTLIGLGDTAKNAAQLADGTYPWRKAKIDAAGNQNVNLPSVVSTANSTTAVLAASGVFTGTSEDISQYASVTVQLFTSHVSATDGLSIQQSPDGTNWDNIDAYTIPATTGKNFGVHVSGKFFRVVYTNGATLQTAFRLQTIFHTIAVPTSSVRPQDARGNDNDMQEVIAYGGVYNGTSWDRLRGDTTAGAWVQVKAALPAGTNTIGNVGSSSPTGATVPANAFYLGIGAATNSLTGASATIGDNPGSSSVLATGMYYYDAVNGLQRVRAATSANGTTGIGVPAAGIMGFDGTNYQRIATDTAGFVKMLGSAAAGSASPANALYMGMAFGANLVGLNAVGNIGDGNTGSSSLVTSQTLWNNTTYDRIRNNYNTTTGDTGAKTATFNGAMQTNYNARGATIVLNIGAVSGTTPSLIAQLQGSADGGTTYYNVPGTVFATITATGVYTMTVYPGATVSANASASLPLPRNWRVIYTITGTTPSFTITNVQVAYIL